MTRASRSPTNRAIGRASRTTQHGAANISSGLPEQCRPGTTGKMTHTLRMTFLCLGLIAGANASSATCQRADFEAVVDEAAGVLRNLNAMNKPKFQEKLRQLKTKRGWSQEEFLKEAAPLVADDTIQGYDRKSAELLEAIASGGQAGASAAAPDCRVLEQLRTSMKSLVDAQTSKWSYMSDRIDAELSR